MRCAVPPSQSLVSDRPASVVTRTVRSSFRIRRTVPGWSARQCRKGSIHPDRKRNSRLCRCADSASLHRIRAVAAIVWEQGPRRRTLRLERKGEAIRQPRQDCLPLRSRPAGVRGADVIQRRQPVAQAESTVQGTAGNVPRPAHPIVR